MYTFTSVNNGYSIYGEPVDGVPEFMIDFVKIGSMGRYITNDTELANKLRQHPDFGKRFMEIGLNAKENPSIVQGIRGSSDHPELGKSFDKDKLIEYGRLQVTLLKKDGSYRKDASAEDITKYEQLKLELES